VSPPPSPELVVLLLVVPPPVPQGGTALLAHADVDAIEAPSAAIATKRRISKLPDRPRTRHADEAREAERERSEIESRCACMRKLQVA
jgi:hypothetical protein